MDAEAIAEGDLLRAVPQSARAMSELGRHLDWLEPQRGHRFENYDDLWRWSVDYLELLGQHRRLLRRPVPRPYERVLAGRADLRRPEPVPAEIHPRPFLLGVSQP